MQQAPPIQASPHALADWHEFRTGHNATLIGRYVGGGTYDVSRKPAQLGFQDVADYAVFDGQVSFKLPLLGKEGQIYLNVRNLFDRSPRIAPLAGNLAIDTNPFLYDTVGRMFRFGIKAGF